MLFINNITFSNIKLAHLLFLDVLTIEVFLLDESLAQRGQLADVVLEVVYVSFQHVKTLLQRLHAVLVLTQVRGRQGWHLLVHPELGLHHLRVELGNQKNTLTHLFKTSI